MDIKEFQDLMNSARSTWNHNQRYRIIFGEDIMLSIQASANHYCTPRESDLREYLEWEIGYPSEKIEELMMYAENSKEPLNTIYAYVPTEKIVDIINKYGNGFATVA